MNNLGFVTVVASGLAAAILGLAAPAHAVAPGDAQRVLNSAPDTRISSDHQIGIDHLNWLDDIRPKVKIPKVDTSVQQRR